MRKHVKARQARNLALGKLDAANRCAFCRRALPETYWIFLTASGEPVRYCSADCRRDQLDSLGQEA